MNRHTMHRALRHAALLCALSALLQARAQPANAEDPGGSRRDRDVAVRNGMTRRIETATLSHIPAREAFAWWSRATGIPLIVNWDALADDGIDAERPIDITLRHVPARDLLDMMARQLSDDEELLVQPTRHYVEILTRRQANRQTEVRIYDVADLLHVAPHFRNAPEFDLQSALSNTNSGGGGSRGGSGRSGSGGGSGGNSMSVFGDTSEQDEEPVKTRAERGEELADLIRETIEPDIWADHGGQHSAIRYFDGRLIIRAPRYVHEQIGIPTINLNRGARRPLPSMTSRGAGPTTTRARYVPRATNGVTGVQRLRPNRVSGVARPIR